LLISPPFALFCVLLTLLAFKFLLLFFQEAHTLSQARMPFVAGHVPPTPIDHAAHFHSGITRQNMFLQFIAYKGQATLLKGAHVPQRGLVEDVDQVADRPLAPRRPFWKPTCLPARGADDVCEPLDKGGSLRLQVLLEAAASAEGMFTGQGADGLDDDGKADSTLWGSTDVSMRTVSLYMHHCLTL
jgi:hypothetical protein